MIKVIVVISSSDSSSQYWLGGAWGNFLEWWKYSNLFWVVIYIGIKIHQVVWLRLCTFLLYINYTLIFKNSSKVTQSTNLSISQAGRGSGNNLVRFLHFMAEKPGVLKQYPKQVITGRVENRAKDSEVTSLYSLHYINLTTRLFPGNNFFHFDYLL